MLLVVIGHIGTWLEKPNPLAVALTTLDQFLLDPDAELRKQFALLEKQVAEREREPTEQADGFT